MGIGHRRCISILIDRSILTRLKVEYRKNAINLASAFVTYSCLCGVSIFSKLREVGVNSGVPNYSDNYYVLYSSVYQYHTNVTSSNIQRHPLTQYL